MRRKTGVVYSDVFLEHITGDHPERPERLSSVVGELKRRNLWDVLAEINFSKVNPQEVTAIHSGAMIKRAEDVCARGGGHLDPDTVCSERSYEVALLALGGVKKAVDAVIGSGIERALCLVRPPGHHATRNKSMGFCIFNNVAFGAQYCIDGHGLSRVAVIDWDLHHGNGTQDIFYSTKKVFYVSMHQYPFYPGTGDADEKGYGEGEGFTLNVPVYEGAGDSEYLNEFNTKVVPAIENYEPEMIFISAGFDSHKDDPLGGLGLSEKSYYEMTKTLCRLSDKFCNGRIISVLEGGYDLNALGSSVAEHVNALLS